MLELTWTIALLVLPACSDEGPAPVDDDTGSEGSSSSGFATAATMSPESSEAGGSPTQTGGESSSSDASSSGSGSDSDGSSGASDSSSGDGTSTTTGVDASSSDGDPSSEDSGDSSAARPDVGGDGSCSTYDDECPAGQKCNAYAFGGGNEWNALGCFDLDPTPDGEGEPCTVVGAGVSGEDSCAQGLICWSVDTETNIGECVPYCQGSADAPTCANGAECTITNEDSLNLCIPPCDPLAQDCSDDELCVAVENAFICAPDAGGLDGQAGDPCAFLNVCDAGLMCAVPEAVPGCVGFSGCCTPFCDVTSPSANADCASDVLGSECVAFFAEGVAPRGLEDVGVCIDA